MHLAHNKAAIKVVYDKAIYLPQRKKMVQWYARLSGYGAGGHDRGAARRIQIDGEPGVKKSPHAAGSLLMTWLFRG